MISNHYSTSDDMLHRSAILVIVLLPALAVHTSNAQSGRFPDSRIGNALEALISALESGKEMDIDQFIDDKLDVLFIENMGRDAVVRTLMSVHESLYPFEVTTVAKTGPWSAECVLAAIESDERLRISFDVSARAPHRLTGLGLEPAGGIEFPVTSLEQLGAYLDERADEGSFAGVVLVARGTQIDFHEAYGLASKRFGIPNQRDTKFNIGSINKMFTGVAVLQLAEKGRLKLDDPIGEYLTGFPDDVATSVTIRQLLAHRSGWGSYWDNEYYQSNWSRLRSVSDYIAFIRNIPLDFTPGSSEQYSNIGYEVLGAIIESASGSDYYDYVRDNIFVAAGIRNTDSYHADEIVPNLATGYMLDEGGAYSTENTFRRSVRGTPAGGGYSTAEDLLRFLTALLNGRLLESTSVVRLFNRYEDPGPGARLDGGVGFAGGGPGISAVVEIEFEEPTVVLVLSNYDPPTAEELGPPIARLMRTAARD